MRRGRTIWIAEAHRDDGKRFIVRADEMLTAFLELKGGSVFTGGLKINHRWSKFETRRPNNEARNSLHWKMAVLGLEK
jgi:hypothetical protein